MAHFDAKKPPLNNRTSATPSPVPLRLQLQATTTIGASGLLYVHRLSFSVTDLGVTRITRALDVHVTAMQYSLTTLPHRSCHHVVHGWPPSIPHRLLDHFMRYVLRNPASIDTRTPTRPHAEFMALICPRIDIVGQKDTRRRSDVQYHVSSAAIPFQTL
ncbi:hypothetical protein BD413DRAFT_559037 [Trametes elegans]|nr:hypothetical protein BD413DRAFT_559037 [Trametes elegans]